MLQSPLLGLGEEDESDMTDWNLPLAFMKKRHCEKIEGSKSLAQSWRMKDRVMIYSRRFYLGGRDILMLLFVQADVCNLSISAALGFLD